MVQALISGSMQNDGTLAAGASALQSGAIVACHIYYGGGTHAVLATGYDNGKTMVYDPIGGKYWQSASHLWNSQSYVWNDRLSGTSIIALW